MNIREMVFNNLDNALDNRYFDEGEVLHNASAYDIACDMIAFAVDAENIDDPNTLVPHIKAWAAEKKLPLRD